MTCLLNQALFSGASQEENTVLSLIITIIIIIIKIIMAYVNLQKWKPKLFYYKKKIHTENIQENM